MSDTITLGAFEAKTHFSQLLKEVEQGKIVHVTRHGKPVATISPEGVGKEQAGNDALDRISIRRKEIVSRKSISTGEILEFRDQGR